MQNCWLLSKLRYSLSEAYFYTTTIYRLEAARLLVPDDDTARFSLD